MLDHLMWMIGADTVDTRKDYSLFGGWVICVHRAQQTVVWPVVE